MSIASINTPSQVSHTLRQPVNGFERPAPTGDQIADAKELKDAFSQFVGTTVFGQMLASMRETVGEPAYFHGGRAEEVFQGQLDQELATRLANSGRSSFADGMFEHQFPKQAEVLKQAETLKLNETTTLDQIAALPRR